MIRRLRIKFVCIIMLIVAIMLTVIFCMLLHFTWLNMENQSIQVMQSIREELYQKRRVNGERWNSRVPYILLGVNREGEMFTSYNPFFENLNESDLRDIYLTVNQNPEKSAVLEKYQLRFLKTTTSFGEMIICVDITSEREIFSDLIKSCLFIAGISMLVFFLITWMLSKWLIRPVENAWNQQRQFVADASHELKTPLTVILTNAELLQNDNYSPEEQKKFTSGIYAMSHQMRGLVEGLLDLARVDNGAVNMVFSELDFAELISDELLPFEPLFFERELEIFTQIESNVRIQGSEIHLRQLMNILLDNASKYSLTPGEVRIELKKQGSHCLLAVSNPCEDISRKELKNIFRRFYRRDKVRSMSHSYGLGLAIAEALVREHRGRIWAECKEGRITFFVMLPL